MVPIHYGITGLAEYVETDDPIGQLQRAARDTPVRVQVVAPGGWVDWTR